jgi:hypothetical protein
VTPSALTAYEHPPSYDRPAPSAAQYLPQLDSLRAFAVFAVMVGHLAARATAALPLGELGVRLFFVLSGFLITRILLQCRALIANGARPAGVIGRPTRRFLRLAPAFTVCWSCGWLVFLKFGTVCRGICSPRQHLLARIGEWHGAVVTSGRLAVEEQFISCGRWWCFSTSPPANAILVLVVAIGPVFQDWSERLVAGHCSRASLWSLG